MRSFSLLLAAGLSLTLSGALAQTRPGPAYFLRHPTSAPGRGLVLLPGGPLPELPMVGPLPTGRAAYAPLNAPVGQLAVVSAAELAPRPDLTGSRAYPAYDPYQNLPEIYRKYTLPPVWAEPLPRQLLRSALAR